MRSGATIRILALAVLAGACRRVPAKGPATDPLAADALLMPEERHLRDLRKLTAGGENAEAYWSDDGTRLIYQAREGERTCDEMRILDVATGGHVAISSDGAHSCGYFLKGDRRVLFASTRLAGPDCPPPPDRSQGYTWALHPDFDIWTSKPDGSDAQRLTDTPGYDAEATVGPDGRIVFTSVRDGDLDLYSMDEDGSHVQRLTDTPGYDGGAVFSPDGKLIVYRAHHPEGEELAEYRELLARNLVRPTQLEIQVMNSDGSQAHAVTALGHAAFAPTFTPDGKRILFASNHADPSGREFDLWLVGLDGSQLERVTHAPAFDGFPLFTRDGRYLAFCSNRGGSKPGETNVFVARWVD
jgi:Tol biopolymer transport system component